MNRRELLTSAGTGVLTALAGCPGEDGLTGISKLDLPVFLNGWAKIQKDTNTIVVLQFDEKIQERINKQDVEGDDLIPSGKDSDIQVELFESTRFEQAHINIPPEVNPEKTAKGRLKNFVGKQQAGEAGFPAPWYSTDRVFLSEEIEIDDNAQFVVRFPSGYEYRLPTIHNKFDYGGAHPKVKQDLDRPHSGLFDYGEHDTDRTIPFIDHFDYAPMIPLRASAQYRRQLVSKLGPLYDWEHEYYSGSIDDLVTGINEIAGKLILAALESVITAPLPRAASAAVDIYGIHDALSEDFEEFQQAANSMNQLIMATQNEGWMDFVNNIFVSLSDKSREAHDRNVTLATASNGDNFEQHLVKYEERLTADAEYIRTQLENEEYQAAFVTGDYWESLHSLAGEVLQELRGMLVQEREAVRELQSNFA